MYSNKPILFIYYVIIIINYNINFYNWSFINTIFFIELKFILFFVFFLFRFIIKSYIKKEKINVVRELLSNQISKLIKSQNIKKNWNLKI